MDDAPSLSPHRKLPFVAVAICMCLLLLASIYFIFHKRHAKGVDPAFSKYIESYTSGIISKEGTIRIRLAGQVPTTHVQNDKLPDNVFDFSPSIKGKEPLELTYEECKALADAEAKAPKKAGGKRFVKKK